MSDPTRRVGQRPAEPGPSQAAKLATLLDALGGIPISDAERRSLIHLAGDEVATVENIAKLIRRARAARGGAR